MAQKNKPKQGKRAPSYSVDSIVVRLIIGLILIALGVLIFLATALNMTGDVFLALGVVSRGLAGTLAIALPAIPIWGGILIILSAQRKPPVRPFVLSCVLFVLICATVTLLTFVSGGSSLMDGIEAGVRGDGVGEDMSAFLTRAYQYGSGTARNDGLSVGGGFLGMLLAWPLWKAFSAVGGGVITILLSLVAFLFLIRLDMKGIAAGIRQKSGESRARRQQQQMQQQEQELLWQQEQANRQQQMRMQQEQLRQQQAAGRQRVQPAPQQQPAADPSDPWNNMMPAGAAQWNETQGRMRPVKGPVVKQVDPHPQQPQPQQPIGFQPTPEERGQYAAPRNMPQAQNAPAEPARRGLFSRSKNTDAAPRRKGVFDTPVQEEAAAPRQEQYAAPMADPQPAPAPQSEPDTLPAQEFAPARQPRTASRKSIVQPVPEEDVPEQLVIEEELLTPAPASKPAREGSFMARLQAAQAAAQGKPAPATAPAETTAPAAKRSRKDTPSAWSQPDAAAGNASWRTETTPQPAARPSARGAAAPKKQKPTSSWADTPPWEDSPESHPIEQPSQVVVPVAANPMPEGVWQPEVKLAPRRQNAMTAMDDGTLMETEQERPYVFPSMSLLKTPEPQAGTSPEEDDLRSRRLESTLQSFRVPAKVRHITHGPAISRFELELAPGVKVSKVTDLNRNIAMNMEVKSVRIEAPIPGKSLVGVEVPNRERATVTLREVLESEPMRKANKPLVVALGKDIAGTPIVCDLAKMPHLLIAGATGSGKSVCINTIINSLLYRCTPKEVRLILVDPKVVELQCYNGIPHLLVPVVSDPHKASGALAWAVGEMMDRYKRFQEAGVRAIDGFNEQMPEDEKMPRIVIVIDELADLMMTCKKDVEERICRLAQLARAAGIHLIVATQRPSVDVITGLIKANIPSRIAFKVSSNVDSRTILDRIGAEQLLGYGDMLYMPTGEFTPIRVQGCFLPDPEVNRITDFIRETCPASYDPLVLEELEKLQNDTDAINVPTDAGSDDYVGGDGSLLTQCIEMAVNDGQVSTSLIQRRLKLGYARAGRLVDEMEKRGIVSQKDGAKPRMCLISREEFEMMKDSGALD